jgi:hypothetical protein
MGEDRADEPAPLGPGSARYGNDLGSSLVHVIPFVQLVDDATASSLTMNFTGLTLTGT